MVVMMALIVIGITIVMVVLVDNGLDYGDDEDDGDDSADTDGDDLFLLVAAL